MTIERAGMAALTGLPNTGKSTLLNALRGEKLAIVSPKPQTTRARLCAVINSGGTQLVLIDTPGVTAPKNRLGEYMRRVVTNSLAGADVIVLLVEPAPQPSGEELRLAERLGKYRCPLFLVINKTDTVEKERLLPVIDAYKTICPFEHIVPLSAKTKDGVDLLLSLLLEQMPRGGALFPEDMSCDMPEKTMLAELIREKVLLFAHEEVPHGAAVVVEDIAERPDGLLAVDAVVFCERESHKGILIGKGGAAVKHIGSAARAELEEMYERKVLLRLRVKTKANWRDDPGALARFGYG
jgi:GTP-binding protein Era